VVAAQIGPVQLAPATSPGRRCAVNGGQYRNYRNSRTPETATNSAVKPCAPELNDGPMHRYLQKQRSWTSLHYPSHFMSTRCLPNPAICSCEGGRRSRRRRAQAPRIRTSRTIQRPPARSIHVTSPMRAPRDIFPPEPAGAMATQLEQTYHMGQMLKLIPPAMQCSRQPGHVITDGVVKKPFQVKGAATTTPPLLLRRRQNFMT
jgi:hypothetical protein